MRTYVSGATRYENMIFTLHTVQRYDKLVVHLASGKARPHSIQAIRFRKTATVFSDQIHRVFCPFFVLFVIDL
jgi:hypothetical protein